MVSVFMEISPLLIIDLQYASFPRRGGGSAERSGAMGALVTCVVIARCTGIAIVSMAPLPAREARHLPRRDGGGLERAIFSFPIIPQL